MRKLNLTLLLSCAKILCTPAPSAQELEMGEKEVEEEGRTSSQTQARSCPQILRSCPAACESGVNDHPKTYVRRVFFAEAGSATAPQ